MNNTIDPAVLALNYMRELQDIGGAALRRAEISALCQKPTTRAGALELLRFLAVELQDSEADLDMIGEAILRCVGALESEA